MKNNKGVTLLSLIVALLLVSILMSITVATSMNSYNQMKFEGAKSELEEVKKLVDEIAADYQTYLKEIKGTGEGTRYQDYFAARYNADFEDKLLSNHVEHVETLLKIHKEIDVNSIATFYFTSDDLAKYFGLKGIECVVVDFSTRTAYSVDGIRDPRKRRVYYFTPADWGANTTVVKNIQEENTLFITATMVSNYEKTYDVELVINPKINNAITDVYLYSGDKYVKINNFRNISSEERTIIRVTVEGRGLYQFMIVDELNNNYKTKTNLVLE